MNNVFDTIQRRNDALWVALDSSNPETVRKQALEVAMSPNATLPKKGEIYQHKHFLEGNSGKPLQCKVTKIAKGAAYYRAYYGKHEDGTDWLGSPWYVDLSKFWKSFEPKA